MNTPTPAPAPTAHDMLNPLPSGNRNADDMGMPPPTAPVTAPAWAVRIADEISRLCFIGKTAAQFEKDILAIIAKHAPVADAAQPHENTCGCFGCVEGRREIEGQRKRIRELEADPAKTKPAPVPAVSDPVKGEPYILRQMRQRLNDSSLQCISTEERQDIIDFITTAKAAAVNAERERDEANRYAGCCEEYMDSAGLHCAQKKFAQQKASRTPSAVAQQQTDSGNDMTARESKDSARLDWLERNQKHIYLIDPDCGSGNWSIERPYETTVNEETVFMGTGKTLREAIDAAMKGTQ